MKFPVSWLKEFVEIPGTVQELADKLSLSGTEVEGIETIGADISGVIAGKIDSIEKHPDADRLVITQISDGTTLHQIVTGATNVFVGAIVPVSLPGAKLAGGLKIKKGKLRGVPSNGMLCSEAELGIAEDAKGIWILPEDTPIGVDLIEYAGIQDTLLDIGILPNRGDCQGIIGLAREIATLYKVPLKHTTPTPHLTKGTPKTSLQNKATSLCPYYQGVEIQLNTPQKTPLWMQRRLQLCGIKPISLPVDITNYVLLEYGQPLHAFDADKLADNTLVIRSAQAEETIQTLDDEKRSLSEGMLVIADTKSPQAIAGVMGGKDSEITDTTATIILEAAYFDPTHVRRNGVSLGLRTESATRFEKGVDLQHISTASNRAAELFQTLAQATIIDTPLISQDSEHPLAHPKKLAFDAAGINALLGTTISESEQLETLASLGFIYDASTQTVTVPSWRQGDIEELPCLAEEIARLIGYDQIPPQLPKGFVPISEPARHQHLSTQCRQFIKTAGFMEIQTYPMMSSNMIKQAGFPEQPERLHIQNPISEEQSIMRPSLLPSLLKAVKFNSTHQQPNLKFYEIGSTYQIEKNEITETKTLSAILTGEDQPQAYTATEKAPWSFFTLKTAALKLIDCCDCDGELTFQTAQTSYFHPVEALDIYIGTQKVGSFGRIHPQIQRTHKLTQPLGYIELNIDTLAQQPIRKKTFTPIPKTPHTRRDFAFVAPKTLKYEEIMAVIQKHTPSAVQQTALFDLFESKELGENHQSLAFSFIYQDPEESLSDDAVNAQHQTLMDTVLAELSSCQLR